MKRPLLLALCLTLLLLVSVTSTWATDYQFSFFDYPGGTPTDPMSTVLYGINDSGQMVGSYSNSETNGYFIYSGGTFTNIGDLPNLPCGISNSGLIAGYYFVPGSTPETYSWVGYMRSPTTGLINSFSASGSNYTVVTGVNSLNQVCGYYYNADMTAVHWYTYDGTNFNTLTDFPNPAGSYLQGPNAHGQLVGSYQDASNNTVYVIGPQGGPFMTLPTPTTDNPNIINGINDQGQVVGYAGLGGKNQTSTFIATSDGYLILPDPPLNGASFTETDPYGINNAGVVVGEYYNSNGEFRGLIYSTTPIPPGLLLLGSGLLGLLGWRRFRRS